MLSKNALYYNVLRKLFLAGKIPIELLEELLQMQKESLN